MKDWRQIEFVVPIQENRTIGDDFFIRGVAINETTTRNGTTFIAEELSKSAPTLREKPILKDHRNSVDSIVGRTTNNVSFNEVTKSIEFEGKIMDNDIKQKIRDGRIRSVSVGAFLSEDSETVTDEDGNESVIARGIDFVELSLVAVPADPDAGFSRAIMEALKLKESFDENFNTEEEREIRGEAIKLIKNHDTELQEVITKAKKKNNNQTKEDINMSDEMAEKLRAEFGEKLKAQKEELEAQTNAIKEERLSELRDKYIAVTKERGLDSSSVDKFDAETLKTLISHLAVIPIKSEAEEETKDEPEKPVDEPAKEEEPVAAEEPAKEEETKEEETKEEKMKDETKGFVGNKIDDDTPTGYVLERSGDFNGGIGFYRKFESLLGDAKYSNLVHTKSYSWEGGN